MIRVAYIEDHRGQRESFTALLETVDDMQCAGVFPHARAALAGLSADDPPDIVIIDYHLGAMTGVQCLEQLQARFEGRPVHYLMLTIERADATIVEALAAGADGYLAKEEITAADVIDAIRRLHDGGSPMSRDVSRKVVAAFRREPAAAERVARLSRRERQLLGHLADGRSLKESADAMGLAFHTVASYTKKLYRKLGVNSAREAVRATAGALPPKPEQE